MSLNEFDIIQQYFSSLTRSRKDVMTGIGDDCALLVPETGKILAVSTDTLVVDRHFLLGVDPASLGHKCLAVNLSDLAAMGAEPCWVTLALTLPEVNENWLNKFSQGFGELANKHKLQLVGGDTTRGALSITLTVHGQIEQDKVLKRDGARVGDLICVTGTLGQAAQALNNIINGTSVSEMARKALERPEPRVTTGIALKGLATACIDISDGLIADLGHISSASKLKAVVEKRAVPGLGNDDSLLETVLTGGDDYELCFTFPEKYIDRLAQIAEQTEVSISVIGRMSEGQGVELIDEAGQIIQMTDKQGYLHFS
jgi:thiamine-monophosphate kinase